MHKSNPSMPSHPPPGHPGAFACLVCSRGGAFACEPLHGGGVFEMTILLMGGWVRLDLTHPSYYNNLVTCLNDSPIKLITSC